MIWSRYLQACKPGKSHHHSCAQHSSCRQNRRQEYQLKSPTQAAHPKSSKQILQRPNTQYEHVCILINIKCAPHAQVQVPPN